MRLLKIFDIFFTIIWNISGKPVQVRTFSAAVFLLKTNYKNNRTMCETWSKLTIKTTTTGVFLVNFEQISHIVLAFLLWTLNKWTPVGLFANSSFNTFIRKILVPRKQTVRQPLRQFRRHTQAIFLKKGKNIPNFSVYDDVISNYFGFDAEILYYLKFDSFSCILQKFLKIWLRFAQIVLVWPHRSYSVVTHDIEYFFIYEIKVVYSIVLCYYI